MEMKMTEIKEARLKSGLRISDIAGELNMSNGLYSLHENGRRQYKGEKYEIFYANVQKAITKLLKKYNTTNGVQLVKVKEEDGEEEELYFNLITEDVLDTALIMLSKGKTLISVAVDLGVDYDTLQKKVKEYELGVLDDDFSDDEYQFLDDLDYGHGF